MAREALGRVLRRGRDSIFLPLEVWDGYNKFHEHKSVVLALCTFAINIAAVVYLVCPSGCSASVAEGWRSRPS